LSSYKINSGKYRNGKPLLPNLFNIKIQFDVSIDPSWDVVIWRNSKLFYDKIGTYKTDNGIVTFPWNAGQNNHWSEALSDNFRIIKVFNNGVPILAKGLSIWDVEEAYIKNGFKDTSIVIL
jgi:hypothetical protein